MAYTKQSTNTTTKFVPKFQAMSAYEIYMAQVSSTLEPIRAQMQGLSYLPPQLGGISGQLNVLQDVLVLQLIDFEVD